jgi:hypothetical protein
MAGYDERGELHRILKYALYLLHLRQAAPDCIIFFFYFLFPCGEAAKKAPLFFCRKAAMFQTTNPAILRSFIVFISHN